MCPDQRSGLQGKTSRGSFFMEFTVFITIFKGIQETTDLDYGFASGLRAQALESDLLGLITLNCSVALGRLLTSLIFSFLTHKVEVAIIIIM